MKTREHKALLLCLRGVLALFAYLVLLFYAHVHVALEAHEHGSQAHAGHHAHDPGEEHSSHAAGDHTLADSTSRHAPTPQLPIHHYVIVADPVLAPAEEAPSRVGWIEGRPKHPPPRLPEQPRSPPVI